MLHECCDRRGTFEQRSKRNFTLHSTYEQRSNRNVNLRAKLYSLSVARKYQLVCSVPIQRFVHATESKPQLLKL